MCVCLAKTVGSPREKGFKEPKPREVAPGKASTWCDLEPPHCPTWCRAHRSPCIYCLLIAKWTKIISRLTEKCVSVCVCVCTLSCVGTPSALQMTAGSLSRAARKPGVSCGALNGLLRSGLSEGKVSNNASPLNTHTKRIRDSLESQSCMSKLLLQANGLAGSRLFLG